jgi:16S rRNA (guanine(966)-N(2))-methyltransferase RsmD
MSAPSPKVRPTARRLRELLFDELGAQVGEARFLDLCAGSGAVGIEALSRGASHVTFVDRSQKACAFIAANLETCGVREDEAEVWASDCVQFLRRAAHARLWDIVFFDPPYRADYESILSLFGSRTLLKRRSGVLVAEHHGEHHLQDTAGRLRRMHTIRQGDSCLSFYQYR